MATLLASPRGMRELGQPRRPPWYPAYRIVANVFWSHLVGRLPARARTCWTGARRGRWRAACGCSTASSSRRSRTTRDARRPDQQQGRVEADRTRPVVSGGPAGVPEECRAQDVKPLQKVLIANRGEIAVRVIRACKDAGIGSVAVYAEPDRDAVFVRLADEAHSLDGATPADSYLDIEKIVAAAEKSGADSVHPGYGFLAENADFAQAVIDAGLVWIGPPPKAIENLGDKAKAKHIAERANAPLAPGTKDPVKDADEIVAFAKENGLPVAIKAVFGGGGRGLKVARTIEEIPDAFDSAVREAVSAFGRGECLVEKFLDKPRHVETQCLADQHGNVVVVSTRDCSLQRRNQKLVEEAPAPFLTDDQVSRLYESSKAILREAEYVGAGTCEFLVAQDGTISFLEVNTRLQVEHCVSEEVTGHRPGPRDVPHRRRRGARVRRPEDQRPLHRVPDQRRGRRGELHAGARHPDPLVARRAARASGSTAATRRARPSPAPSTR